MDAGVHGVRILNLKMKQQTIILACGKGTIRHVQAYIVGPFGIHRDVGKSQRFLGWNLTHVKSGIAVKKFISFRLACKLAKALKHLDWDFTDPDDAKFKAIKNEAWKIIKSLI